MPTIKEKIFEANRQLNAIASTIQITNGKIIIHNVTLNLKQGKTLDDEYEHITWKIPFDVDTEAERMKKITDKKVSKSKTTKK